MGTVKLIYDYQTEYLNHRSGCVVCHNSKCNLKIDAFARFNQKEPRKLRLLSMEDIDFGLQPEQRQIAVRRKCCTMKSKSPVIQQL